MSVTYYKAFTHPIAVPDDYFLDKMAAKNSFFFDVWTDFNSDGNWNEYTSFMKFAVLL